MATLLDTYEALPYESNPMYLTHPAHLAALALLHGMQPPPVTACRVLELGCASGGNLVPMALGLPGSRFVGVDLSPRQIAAASGQAGRLGLRNLELHAGDLRALPADLGPFDYIIAHGVYSWVSPEVQDALLSACARLLAPDGVAYVSYNTYPGCHLRDIVRDLMLFHTRRFTDPKVRVRQARGVLDFVARSVPEPEDTYRRVLQQEARILSRRSDEYLAHDHLEVESRPVYFADFVEHAGRHGLHYLAEAEFSLIEGLLPAETRQVLDQLADDLIALEQYRDFLFNRRFRQTLLCHAAHGPGLRFTATPEVLSRLFVRGLAEPARPGGPWPGAEEFRKPDGVGLTTDNPLVKAILHTASAAGPRALPYPALVAQVGGRLPALGADIDEDDVPEAVAACLAECFLARLVELSTFEPDFCTEPGERPQASPLARLQAEAGPARLTNLRHRMVELEELDLAVLRQLDGQRDHAAIVAGLVAQARAGALKVQQGGQALTDEEGLRRVLTAALPASLRRLGRAALLI